MALHLTDVPSRFPSVLSCNGLDVAVQVGGGSTRRHDGSHKSRQHSVRCGVRALKHVVLNFLCRCMGNK
jgi:hypothetical protein